MSGQPLALEAPRGKCGFLRAARETNRLADTFPLGGAVWVNDRLRESEKAATRGGSGTEVAKLLVRYLTLITHTYVEIRCFPTSACLDVDS